MTLIKFAYFLMIPFHTKFWKPT